MDSAQCNRRIIEDDKLSTFEHRTLQYARWGFGVAIVTLVIAVVTGLVFYGQFSEMANQTDFLARAAKQARIDAKDAGIAAGKQLDIAQKQAKAAQDSVAAINRQMRQDQRAWVVPTYGQWNVVQDPMTKKWAVSIPVTVTNTGKTPAIHSLTITIIETVDNGKSPSFSYKGPGVSTTIGSLFPNDPLPTQAELLRTNTFDKKRGQVRTLLPEEYDDLQRGNTYLAVFGISLYRDVFGTRHWVKFCIFANTLFSGPVTARGCTNYNDVDKR